MLRPLFIACLTLAPLSVMAQNLMPQGGEFQVNTYTLDAQASPRLAFDAAGGFVVVWESSGSSGDDTLSYSVQGQRFSSDGMPAGEQFEINGYTTGAQQIPQVARGGLLDDFIVVWRSTDDDIDSDGRSIKARRFMSNGTPLEAEFTVNTYTTGQQSAPRVAVDSVGQAIVVWSSEGSTGTDSDRESIQGQRFTENGSPDGGQFQINSYTTKGQVSPAVAMTPDDGFVVVWTSTGSAGDDTDDTSIQALLFASDGAAINSQFQVNTYTTFRQQDAAVTVTSSGALVIAWTSSESVDDSDNSVQARLFASDGAALGDQFRVNAYTTSFQRAPAITHGEEGSFLIVWDSGEAVADASLTSVQAQLFAAEGSPLGAQVQVNTYASSFQFDAGVAADGAGGFVAVWGSYGSFGSDTNEGSIQGQRFAVDLPFFTDGFESGETSAWSEEIP